MAKPTDNDVDSVVIPALSRLGITMLPGTREHVTGGFYMTRKAVWDGGMELTVEVYYYYGKIEAFRVYAGDYVDSDNSGIMVYYFGSTGDLMIVSVAGTRHINCEMI